MPPGERNAGSRSIVTESPTRAKGRVAVRISVLDAPSDADRSERGNENGRTGARN